MQTTHFRTTTSKLLLALASLTLGFSACTSDGTEVAEQDPPETTTTTTTIATTSTTATTTSTTDSAPDTATSVDALGKPIIEIPTEWESDLDEIFGRYQLYWDALDIALGPPMANPDYQPLVELTDPDFFEDIASQIERFRTDGVVLVTAEDSISDHVLRLPNPSVLTKEEGNKVVIQDCWVDDSEVRQIDGEIVEVLRESLLRNVTMRVVNGEWRVWAAINASEESSGYQECATYIDELQ